MNHLMVAGNLGADPEVRFTPKGQKVTTLRIAANSRRAGKEETTWWRVTLWGEQFDKVVSFLKKGSSVMVYGELQKPEIFNDREGKPQISLNMTAYHIAFSPFGRGSQQNDEGHAMAGASAAAAQSYGASAPQQHKERHTPAFSEPAFGSGGFDSFGSGGGFFGGGQQDGNFSDEEIPF